MDLVAKLSELLMGNSILYEEDYLMAKQSQKLSTNHGLQMNKKGLRNFCTSTLLKMSKWKDGKRSLLVSEIEQQFKYKVESKDIFLSFTKQACPFLVSLATKPKLNVK